MVVVRSGRTPGERHSLTTVMALHSPSSANNNAILEQIEDVGQLYHIQHDLQAL